nr:Dihydrolipoyllysine-residue acetyltransferase [uncultured bacterium]
MAHILIMPRQGNTVESCIIVEWKVNEGDEVTADTTVCEVETDKAAFEVLAGADGIVLKILYKAGDDVPVLTPIAVIGSVNEDWQAVLLQNIHAATQRRNDAEKTDSIENTVNSVNIEDLKEKITNNNSANHSVIFTSTKNFGVGKESASLRGEDSVKIFISPRARKLAQKEALPMTFRGTGPEGRIIERDVISALENRPPLTIAAKAAVQDAANAAFCQGTGLGGRINLEDISVLNKQQFFIPAPQSPVPYIDTPVKGIRKIISDRMQKSLAETAQFTLNACASVLKLQRIRAKINSNGKKITINDIVLFAASRVLPQFPYMNAHKMGDIIRTFRQIHLGIAVDTQRGLMVPVMRNADKLSLEEVSSQAKYLASACQNGSIKPDELSGSTFTVTNLGSLGITGFTPVLNAPEVAILGVCAIEMKAVPDTEDGKYKFEPHIGFSLTVNHQAVDGAPAARFLKALCDEVANIDLFVGENNV